MVPAKHPVDPGTGLVGPEEDQRGQEEVPVGQEAVVEVWWWPAAPFSPEGSQGSQ
jgi:hypothetical protein